MLGVAWDETLGGAAFTDKLAGLMLTKSKKDPKGNKRVRARRPPLAVRRSPHAARPPRAACVRGARLSPRARAAPQSMAKLTAAAVKTKVILSANKDAHPTIEGFYEDYDYRASVTRAEFQDVAKDLFSRSVPPPPWKDIISERSY